MARRILVAVLLAFALGLGSGCALLEDFNAGFELQIWQAVDVSANYRDGTGTVPGSDVDLIGEANLEDQPQIFAGQVSFQFGRTIYHIDLWQYSENGALTAAKTVDGITYPAGTSVDATFQMLRFGVQQTLLDTPLLYLGFIVGLDSMITSFNFGGDTTEPFVPIPILGGYVEVGLEQIPALKFFADAQTTFIDLIPQDAIVGTMIDIRLGARYQLSKNFFVAAGYRIFDFDIELDTATGGDDDNIAFAANGVTFFGTIRF